MARLDVEIAGYMAHPQRPPAAACGMTSPRITGLPPAATMPRPRPSSRAEYLLFPSGDADPAIKSRNRHDAPTRRASGQYHMSAIDSLRRAMKALSASSVDWSSAGAS